MKRELIKWLKIPGHSEKMLAEVLGYKSSGAVYNWKKRGVPKYLRSILKDYFNGNISEEGFKNIFNEEI